jgi:murein tripeptide amidase MpaA
LEDKPLISEVVLSRLVSEQDWGKTHTKASKNRNHVIGEEHLAHIRTIVVSSGGRLNYLFLYATTELS